MVATEKRWTTEQIERTTPEEDAEDIRISRERMARGGPFIPLEQTLAN